MCIRDRAIVVLLVLTVGLSLFVSASTVRMRDTQHLVDVVLFAWMWLCPIIYPVSYTHLDVYKRQATSSPLRGSVVPTKST